MSHLAPCHRLQGHPLAAPYSLLLEQLQLSLHLQVLQLLGTPLGATVHWRTHHWVVSLLVAY